MASGKATNNETASEKTLKAKKSKKPMRATRATKKKSTMKPMKSRAMKTTVKESIMKRMKAHVMKATIKKTTMKPTKAEAIKRTRTIYTQRIHGEANEGDKINDAIRAEVCGQRIFKISSGLCERCLAEVIGIAWNDEELVVMYEVRYENGRKGFLYETEFEFVEEPSK